MNKKLENTFNLPSMEEALEDMEANKPESKEEKQKEEPVEDKVIDELNIKRALSTAEKIDRALPQVKDLETHDGDMDTYSSEAMKSYKELMDLGMNSEARHAGKMFEVASTMLKNAVEAKNAKADKKLRMIELQLKKQRVEQWDKRDPKRDEVIEGEGYVVGDRNKLLDQLIQKVNETDEESNKEDK
jgi:hypothetical protein